MHRKQEGNEVVSQNNVHDSSERWKIEPQQSMEEEVQRTTREFRVSERHKSSGHGGEEQIGNQVCPNKNILRIPLF